MSRPTAASKGWPLVMLATSPSMKLTLPNPASAARERAAVSVAGSRSTATTVPEGPTSLAANIATSPTPEPTSSTRCPSPRPASRNNRSVKGSKIAAWRISLACSALALLKT